MTNISGFAINGHIVSNHIQELKDGVTIKQAEAAGKDDGLDQVYFSAKGKNYVVSGDGLDLSGLKKGILPYGQVKLDGELINVELKAVDNEVNTAGEGVKNLKNWMLGEAAIFGGGAAYNFATIGKATGEAAMGKAAGFFGLAFLGAVAVGATAAGGAIYGALRGSDEESLKALIK